MADKVKLVDKSIPSVERYFQFTNAELASGDVIRVVDSLGRAGREMTIVTVGDGLSLQIRMNSRQIIYPRRKYPEQESFGWADYSEVNTALGTEVKTGVSQLSIGARGAGTYTFTDIPIRDVEITTSAGTGSFTIIIQ